MELTFKSYYLTQDGVNGCDGQNTSGRNINIPTNGFVQKYATSVDIHLKKIVVNDKPSLQIFQRMNHRTMLSWLKKKGLDTTVWYAIAEKSKAHIVNVSYSLFNLQVCMI